MNVRRFLLCILAAIAAISIAFGIFTFTFWGIDFESLKPAERLIFACACGFAGFFGFMFVWANTEDTTNGK